VSSIVVRFCTLSTQKAPSASALAAVIAKVLKRFIMFKTFGLKRNFIVISNTIDRSSPGKMLHRNFITQWMTLYFLCIFLDLDFRFLCKILIGYKQLFVALLIFSKYEMSDIVKYCFFTASRAINLIFDL